jgi:integrase
LIELLAYSGVRPGEALALRWGDMREKTLLVERAISLGVVRDTKTTKHRAVRLLAPLAQDLREWKLASGRPDDRALIFPGVDGRPWGEEAWKSWRRRAFARALKAAGVEHARPYALRHSFASLLLHEGRSVVDVAAQLGHSPAVCLGTYAHVVAELEGAPRQSAEEAIMAARATSVAHQLPIAEK